MNALGIGQLITVLVKAAVYAVVVLMPFYAFRKPIVKFLKKRKKKKSGVTRSDEPSYVS